MKQIGLISDTHGYLDEAVFRHFDSCDEIWHAGDFGGAALSEQLAGFRPLRGVWGNIDGGDVRALHPHVNAFTVEEVPVYMIHIGGYPNRYAPGVRAALQESGARLFICGHSHILKIVYDPKLSCLHMNPGAAGRQGWHKVRTLVRFTVDGADLRDCSVIELGPR